MKKNTSQNVLVQKMRCSNSTVKHPRVEDRFFNSRITNTYYKIPVPKTSHFLFSPWQELCVCGYYFSRCNSPNARTYLVKLNLYYEPLCPDCQQFINQQLGPNYKRLEKYLEVRLNPYGNARKNGLYNFTCQHGPEECKAARFEGCLISKIEDHHPTVPVINCIETYDPSNPDTIKWVGVA